MGKLIYEELSYAIVGAAIEVHSGLKAGFAEEVYENALMIELNERGIECVQQKHLDVFYKDIQVGHYIADIVVENKVILELKAVATPISDQHIAQTINYLTITRLDLGFILNFGRPKLERKRLINTKRK